MSYGKFEVFSPSFVSNRDILNQLLNGEGYWKQVSHHIVIRRELMLNLAHEVAKNFSEERLTNFFKQAEAVTTDDIGFDVLIAALTIIKSPLTLEQTVSLIDKFRKVSNIPDYNSKFYAAIERYINMTKQYEHYYGVNPSIPAIYKIQET